MKELNQLKQNNVQLLDESQFPVKEETEPETTEQQNSIANAFAKLEERVEKEKEKTEELKQEYEKAKAEYEETMNDVNEMKKEGFIDSDEEDEEDINEDSLEEDEDLEEDLESNQGLSVEDEAEIEDELKELLSDDNVIDDIDEQKEAEESLNKLKSAIRERIKPAADIIDLSSYTISKEPISVNATLDKSIEDEIIFPLFCSERSTRMKRFFASDIEDINPDTRASGLNRLETMKKVYRCFYDHITDANKPSSFEKWLRCTSFMDIKHLYMAAYKSAFDGANFITYTCENEECENVWLSDNIEIDDMIEFENDEVKEKFYELLEKESSITDKLYTTEIIPISSKYAISFHEPSIYNVVFENASLPTKITNKYSDMLSILMYIDTIYMIDSNSHTLKPIALKEFKDSIANTTKVKIYTYSKILKSLTSDQYQILGNYMTKINKRENSIRYIKPEIICPKCGKVIKKEETNPMQLVFQRHNLEAIANS